MRVRVTSRIVDSNSTTFHEEVPTESKTSDDFITAISTNVQIKRQSFETARYTQLSKFEFQPIERFSTTSINRELCR